MSPTKGGGDRDDDDDHAFAEAMRGVRPLPRGPERVVPPPAAHARRKNVTAPSPSVAPFVVEQTGDAIAGRAPDLAVKQLHELRAGAHPVEARLDLHGRKRADALRDLERFVTAARARGARAVLVIHGRGHGSDAAGPILRPAVWEWLASPASARGGVMAFTSARPRDGGDGATLVLLRRRH